MIDDKAQHAARVLVANLLGRVDVPDGPDVDLLEQLVHLQGLIGAPGEPMRSLMFPTGVPEAIGETVFQAEHITIRTGTFTVVETSDARAEALDQAVDAITALSADQVEQACLANADMSKSLTQAILDVAAAAVAKLRDE